MQDNFHKNKIYRVKELIDISGKKAFVVQAAGNLIEAFLGIWKTYAKENDSLNDAINQIESIHRARIKSDRIVHKETKNKP